MFDLSAKETICKFRILKGEKKFYLLHYLRQPIREEWVSFLKGKGFLGYSKGSGVLELSNTSQEEDASFWDVLATKVEGYAIGAKDVMEMEDWKSKIPMAHKLDAIGSLLLFNRGNAPEDESVAASEAFDLADESATDITMIAVQNAKDEYITFSFVSPESSDYVKYNRMATKMQLTKTRQRNVSSIKAPVNLDVSESLFDKLAVKVSGYNYDGKDIMENPKWKSLIPVYHKREVVRELFTGSIRDEDSSD